MRYPHFLDCNGNIGFVAPSFGCATEPYITGFKKAQDRLNKMGYAIENGPNVYEAKGVGISNTPQLCGMELSDMYASQDNDVLISCGGGELMCEILEYVDWDKIKSSKPKWFMGYSDNTNLTFLLNTIADTASIYGPCAAAFGADRLHESQKDALDVLTGKKLTVSGYDMWEKESLKSEDNPTPEYNLTEQKVLRCFNGNKEYDTPVVDMDENTGIHVHGRLIGGCMDCLVNLTGTGYDKVEDFNEKYKEDGIIWFLESCDLNVFAIRRAMWQMEKAGWFKYVRAFVIGRPLVFGQDMMGLDQYSAVLGIAGKYNVPVIMDADIGHLPPAMPVISGAYAEVSVEHGNITFRYSLK